MVVITISDIIAFIILGLFIIGAIALWIWSKIEDFKKFRRKRKE